MTSDPDQIREQIEQTRTSLSEDVSTLADTVNPAHVARRKAATAGAAVRGVKDKIMGTASQSVSSTTAAAGVKASAVQEKASAAQDTISAAPNQLRRQTAGNPLAVGLIAVGAGWLVGSLLPASSAEERAATKIKEAATPAVTDAVKDAAASLQDSAKQAAESVKATAANAAATVKDETANSAHDLKDQAQAAGDTMTGNRQ
jgi:hypothetical protein